MATQKATPQSQYTETDRLARLTGTATLANDDREHIPVEAPFTGDVLGSIPACTEADVETAVERADEAQEEWAERPVSERCEIVLEYHDRVLDRQEELLDVLVAESGKARRHAFEEILDVPMTCQYYADNAPDYVATREREGALPGLTETVEHQHPVGVVGLISPWNYPLSLAVSDAIPALLAGNAVVLKPAEETPFTALLAVELFREAGLPEDVFQVVTGSGPELGTPLIDRADYIGFTGSTATGRIVAEQAGANLMKCSMELGGKNPAIVLDDADVERAAEGLIRGAFTNAGQLCISFERVYVHSDVRDAFLEEFVSRARNLRVAAADDYDVEMGSLMSADQLEKVSAHVDDAIAKGATVHTGGQTRPDLGPYFYEPTVLTCVTEEMELAAEETFGPVVSIYEFDDEERAIEWANDTDYGLNGSVWTEDSERGRAIAKRIEAGTVNVNEAYAAAWASLDAPMGGMKQSGIGRRHGKQGLRRYTEPQTVAEQRWLPMTAPPGVPMEWYAKGMTRAMGLLRRFPVLR
jgi:succinate-semialdehyde dehydrogenase/glutarate-semialdehyde dehydrogenase